jgi:hypothetical protein
MFLYQRYLNLFLAGIDLFATDKLRLTPRAQRLEQR